VSEEATAPLLALRDLRVCFHSPAGTVAAVDGVDLAIQRGETLALVGESGCGKSTLARAVTGLVPVAAGSIRVAGEEWVGRSRRALRPLRHRVQMVFQDPHASLDPRGVAASLIAEPLVIQGGLTRAERERRVALLMEQVGLDPALGRRYPHEFSGGQRQRICIARALAAGPDLVICDEATSALDVSIQAQILNLLGELKSSLGLAYLFITHDLGVVRQLADRVAVMYLGQIVEEGVTDALFADPKHPYTRGLLAAVPTLEPDEGRSDAARVRGDVPSPANPPSGCRFHTRCPDCFERCSREAPGLQRAGSGASRCFLVEEST
jgi:oligopeptide/dipeptide ABC transporter ATP-binding protein